MGIDKFVGIKQDRVKRFEKLASGKSKAEIRELEMALLKPEPTRDYVGEVSKFIPLGDRTLKIVLPNTESYQLLGKYFKITQYIEKSIPNLNLLLDFLRWMDTGALTYDDKTRTFSYHSGKDEQIQVNAGGLKKRRAKIGR